MFSQKSRRFNDAHTNMKIIFDQIYGKSELLALALFTVNIESLSFVVQEQTNMHAILNIKIII